jgi:hypothetical protein
VSTQSGTTSQMLFTSQRLRRSPAAAQALDFGLEVRLELDSSQATIFSGAESLSAQQLSSELAEPVSSLRVRSFSLRAQPEEVTTALLSNVRCGFWPLARRAALDLEGLLGQARRRRLVDPELVFRGRRRPRPARARTWPRDVGAGRVRAGGAALRLSG